MGEDERMQHAREYLRLSENLSRLEEASAAEGIEGPGEFARAPAMCAVAVGRPTTLCSSLSNTSFSRSARFVASVEFASCCCAAAWCS